MSTPPQPHRTRGHRPGYRPTTLDDITIRIHATPGVDAEVWRALHTAVDAAIDSSLKKFGLAAVRSAMTSAGNAADATAYQGRNWAAPYRDLPPAQEGFR